MKSKLLLAAMMGLAASSGPSFFDPTSRPSGGYSYPAGSGIKSKTTKAKRKASKASKRKNRK